MQRLEAPLAKQGTCNTLTSAWAVRHANARDRMRRIWLTASATIARRMLVFNCR